jgi:hypothetical protein
VRGQRRPAEEEEEPEERSRRVREAGSQERQGVRRGWAGGGRRLEAGGAGGWSWLAADMCGASCTCF